MAGIYRNMAVVCALAWLSMPSTVQGKAQQQRCAPLGKTKTELVKLKAAGWQVADAVVRDQLVLALADCNGAPDPELRDGIAFEGQQHLLRKRLVSDAAMVELSKKLQAQMIQPDKSGFRRPFAALNLAEVARADRIKAYLTAEQRSALVTAAVDYMRSITDYRGFDQVAGYRHGVAHAADLIMQLALNQAISKADLTRMRDAIALQVAPTGTSYVTGESERLARPVMFMAQRGLFSDQEWMDWLAQFGDPGSVGSWDSAFQSDAGLARRHNVTAFLSAIYVNAQSSGAEAMKPLAAGAIEAMKKLP